MAASSPTNEHPPTETLISLLPNSSNGHDPIPDATATLTDEITSGENKRKREEEEEQEQEQSQDPSANPLWKTSLCSFFRRQSGSCSHGGECRYAHGEEELRPRPDNTWDPTSERAKKALKKSEDEDKCCEAPSEVMMTEAVVGDGDGDEDGDGVGSEPGLSKCLVHLPRNWRTETLKTFLTEQVTWFFFHCFNLSSILLW